MVFSLAHPYGSPTILSSYSFTDKDAGGPNGGFGTCSKDGGANGWLCQHRWTAVAGMVGFRNNVRDAPLVNWVSPKPEQIAFSRGKWVSPARVFYFSTRIEQVIWDSSLSTARIATGTLHSLPLSLMVLTAM